MEWCLSCSSEWLLCAPLASCRVNAWPSTIQVCALCNSLVYQSLVNSLFHAGSVLIVCWCSKGCPTWQWRALLCEERMKVVLSLVCSTQSIVSLVGIKGVDPTSQMTALISPTWFMHESTRHDPSCSIYNKMHCEMVKKVIWFHVNIPKNDNGKRCWAALWTSRKNTHTTSWILHKRENDNLHVNC